MLPNSLEPLKQYVLQSVNFVLADEQTSENKDLAIRLHETFEKDMAAAKVKGLHFYIKDGVVTIYGPVRHALDRDLIVTLAKQVAGVREVHDNMELTA